MTVQHARKVLKPAMHGTGAVPANYEPLVEVVGAKAEPRALRIRLEDSGREYVGFLAGDPSGLVTVGSMSEVADAGILRIQYGGRTRRTLLCDLQNGDYFLPACENVTVSVARYKPFANSFPQGDVAVDGELLSAVQSGGDYRPLTCTPYGCLAAGETGRIAIPVGAYALDIQAEAYDSAVASGDHDTYIEILSSWTAAGADGPIFETTRGPYILRDYQAGREQPAGIVPLAGHFRGSTTNDRIYITNRAVAGAHMCKAIFYVR